MMSWVNQNLSHLDDGAGAKGVVFLQFAVCVVAAGGWTMGCRMGSIRFRLCHARMVLFRCE